MEAICDFLGRRRSTFHQKFIGDEPIARPAAITDAEFKGVLDFIDGLSIVVHNGGVGNMTAIWFGITVADIRGCKTQWDRRLDGLAYHHMVRVYRAVDENLAVDMKRRLHDRFHEITGRVQSPPGNKGIRKSSGGSRGGQGPP